MNLALQIGRRLVYPMIFAFSALLIAATVQAQDVYNFYFQKAPGATPIIQTPATPSTSAPPVPVVTPVAPLTLEDEVDAPPGATSVTSKPRSEAATEAGFRHWSVQIMHANVADTNSDVSPHMKSRLGFQVGYRFNKFVGLESGTSIGALKGQWQNETGTNAFASIVPFLGVHINALHLNIFGAEIFEFFVNGGAMYIDQTGGQRGGPVGSRANIAEIYGYLGGGMRVNFGERVGLEVAGRVLAGDPANRYGMATTGIDVRF